MKTTENFLLETLEVLHAISVCDIQKEQLPKHLASKVRICDPSVWPTIYAVDRVIQDKSSIDWVSLQKNIGFIMIGDAYPKKITQKVIAEIENQNNVSPMSFINANAGAAISICATQYGFQGPSINFTTRGIDAPLEVGLTLARRWLQLSDVTMLFLLHSYYKKNLLTVDCKLIANKKVK